MNKKGFTLIELLAVIVILAIIALIATPIIMGVIEDSKKNSAKDSAYGYIDGVNSYSAKQMLKDSTFKLDGRYSISADGKLNNIDLSIKGTKPVGGTLTYTDSKVSKGCLTVDGYKITIKNEKAETIEKGTCELIKTYSVGDIVYLNPETNEECASSSVVSTTGTKTGCMKWYVYKDNGNGTYQMILDHNTTANVAWISKEDYIAAGGTEAEYGTNGNNSKGPITVTNKLNSDTSTWDKSLKARLIIADEVAGITGNKIFDSKTSTFNSWFYFDNNAHTQIANATTKSKYAWLYDYTNGCTTYGCNIADSGIGGYWTSDDVTSNSYAVWCVYRIGFLTSSYYANNTVNGVRPVITF